MSRLERARKKYRLALEAQEHVRKCVHPEWHWLSGSPSDSEVGTDGLLELMATLDMNDNEIAVIFCQRYADSCFAELAELENDLMSGATQ